MELPFYLMSQEAPGSSWDGVVSLHGDELHFELRSGRQEECIAFDVPLRQVTRAEFLRGLVSRKLSLRVESEALRQHFPAGVAGEEVHLMVAKEDKVFGGSTTSEEDYEDLVGQIESRGGRSSSPSTEGLAN